MQLVLGICFAVIFLLYAGTMYVFRKKVKENLGQGHSRSKQNVEYKPIVSTPDPNTHDNQLYLERGDRSHWYKLILFFENGDRKEYDFYSYNGTRTKESILEERFFVNNHELLITDETGEHYINRKKLDQVDFLQRKLLQEPQGIQANTSPDTGRKEEELFEGVGQREQPAEEDFSEFITTADFFGIDKREQTPKKKARFSKKKKEGNLSVKQFQVKRFNYFFTGMLLLALLGGAFSFIRTFGVSEQLREAEQGFEAKSQQVSGDFSKTEYPYAMNQFIQEFIDCYIPLSNDHAAMEQRHEKIKRFVSKDVGFEKDVSSVKRTLITSELISVEEQDTFSTACYKVKYQLEMPVEQLGAEPSSEASNDPYIEYKTKEQVKFMKLDFVQQEDKFSIVSYPYFTEPRQVTAEPSNLERNESSSAAIRDEELEEIQKFVAIFFDKYASASKEELMYLMYEVQSLNDIYKVKELELLDAYQHDEFITAYVKTSFLDEETGLLHQENFSLKLVEERQQLKVVEIRHNLGGF